MAFQLNSSPMIVRHLFGPDSADFNFVLNDANGDHKTIAVHRTLFSILSPVFKLLFDVNWKDLSKAEIDGTSYEAFNQFCECFYKDQMLITEEYFNDLFNLAKFYEYDNLVNACEHFMLNRLTTDHAAGLLGSDIATDPANLQIISEFISKNTEDVLKSESFLGSPPNVLRIILKLDRISCPQIQIFDACVEWARRRLEVQPVDMDDVRIELDEQQLHDLIRFKEIDKWDLKDRCKLYACRFFTRLEMLDFLTDDDEDKKKDKDNEKKGESAGKKRKSMTTRKCCYQFNDLGAIQIEEKAEHTIQFSVSENLHLKEVDLSNIVVDIRKFVAIPCVVTLQVVAMKNGNEIYKTVDEFKQLKLQLLSVVFDQNVVIEKEDIYQLYVSIEVKNPCNGRRFIRSHTIENKTVNDVTLKIHQAGRDNEHKIITEMVFERKLSDPYARKFLS